MTLDVRALSRASLAAAIFAAGCQPPGPPPEGCLSPDPYNPRWLQWCDIGSGSFGTWGLDSDDLPVFEHDVLLGDARTLWPTSTGELRRDHWGLIGNDRMTAVVTTEGFVQVFSRDGGPTWINKIDLEEGRLGGGYSYIVEDGRVWSTAPLLAPAEAFTFVRFGVGYAHVQTNHDQLLVSHVLEVPPGQPGYLIDTVTLTNEDDSDRQITHYEVWDVNRHPLEVQTIRSGLSDPRLPASLDEDRAAVNANYNVRALGMTRGALLRHDYLHDDAVTAGPSLRDYDPVDVFLTRLSPGGTAALQTKRDQFYGSGGVEAPSGVRAGVGSVRLLPEMSAEGQPGMLADATALEIPAKQSVTLQYLYGFVSTGQEVPDEVVENETGWRAMLPYAAIPGLPFLQREVVWHGAQLLSASSFDRELGVHMVPQGSAYLFEHGIDGSPRELAAIAVTLIYLRPDLARDQLHGMMRLSNSTATRFSSNAYGFGFGGDLYSHDQSPDHDLYFLWALVEYLSATGDVSFLDVEVAPTAPLGERRTVRQRMRASVDRILDGLGTGEHGLVTLGTGDFVAPLTQEALAYPDGESVTASHMAAYVLPLTAPWLDEDRAVRALAFAEAVGAAADEQWNGSWYRRAWLAPDDPFGDDTVQLDAQVWALIRNTQDPQQRGTLIGAIDDNLDAPSPIGAIDAPGGARWHLPTALLTWGYSQAHPDLAWRSVARHSMNSSALAHPAQWYGAWTGPDAMYPAGGTWQSLNTAMTDHPGLSTMGHAMPLLGLLRAAGISPSLGGDGLRIDPPIRPGEVYTLDFPLLRLTVEADGVFYGEYRPRNDGQTSLYLATGDGDYDRLYITFARDQALEFSGVANRPP